MTKKKIILLIIGMLLSALTTCLVISGSAIEFETAVYKGLHTLPTWLDGFFKVCTMFGETVFVIILLAGIIIFNRKNGKYIVIAAIGNVIINQTLKYIFRRPRPEFEHLVEASGYSFPSGHTMIAISLYGFLLYLTIRYMKNKAGKTALCTLFVCLMILVPLSRIYLGVHFVGDVVAGALISGTYIMLFIEFYKKWIDGKKPADVKK